MLRVLPPMFEPVLQQIWLQAFFRDDKPRNIAIQLVCSNVAKQVARSLLPVLLHLKYIWHLSKTADRNAISISTVLWKNKGL